MIKNSSDAASEKTEAKGVFYQAGEIIGSIGFHIVDGKDKVIGAIKKKLGKKQTPKTKTKNVSKKKAPGKTGNKVNGTAKKPAKKANSSKPVRKKTDKVKKQSKETVKKDSLSTEK